MTPRQFISAHPRARVTIGLLIAGIGLDLLFLAILPLELIFPVTEAEEIGSADAVGIMLAMLQLGVGILTLICYIATVVFFLMWMYRAYENLPALGVHYAEYSSGWAVASFFVPFANLIIPYRAVRELWRKSRPYSDGMFGEQSPPAIFPAWWAFWLLSNFANNIYLRFMIQEDVDSTTSAIGGAITSTLDIISAVLAIMVIKEIDRQQTEKSLATPPESLSLNPPPPPTTFPQAIQS